MLTEAINVFRTNLSYCEGLVGDITAGEYCQQPVAGMNHPAWILGHLAFAFDRHSTLIGGTAELAEWQERLGKGSEMSTDPADYPPKEEMMAVLRSAAERFIAAAEAATPDVLSAPNEYVQPDKLPTLADFIAFSMTAHTATHLGQLSAWRRAVGRAPLF